MLKFCFYHGETEYGPAVIPLFNRRTDAYFEKVASPQLQPDIVSFIETLRPRQDAVYELVNAMGAGEFYGSNTNGDYFSEGALMHKPDGWKGVPILDRVVYKDWPYGFPTFYQACVYQHHRNKEPNKRLGDIEFATWNDRMKRVELVTRVDKNKCEQWGAIPLWDKLKAGMYLDLSMGCRVKFDLCSICLDWKSYKEAEQTFNKSKHKSPDEAILEFHKKNKIKGLSITRKDYCEHCLTEMNRIRPDGRKVFVFNPFPKFFDQSYVFVGADKTSKSMLKLGSQTPSFISLPSAKVAEDFGFFDDDSGTVVDVNEKVAKYKASELVKDTVPSQFAAKAVPLLTKADPEISSSVLKSLADFPISNVLSSTGSMGIVLSPREFQRMSLHGCGMSSLSDLFDSVGTIFPRETSCTCSPMSMSIDNVMPKIVEALLPMFSRRSCFSPQADTRITIIKVRSDTDSDPVKTAGASVHRMIHADLLEKISAAYHSYRSSLSSFLPSVVGVFPKLQDSHEFRKMASLSADNIFSPLTVAYVKYAFLDDSWY